LSVTSKDSVRYGSVAAKKIAIDRTMCSGPWPFPEIDPAGGRFLAEGAIDDLPSPSPGEDAREEMGTAGGGYFELLGLRAGGNR